MSSFKKWYVAQVVPSKENFAKENLVNQNFETFSPIFLKPKSSKYKRGIPSFAPLFPGYLFVSINMERDRWQVINSTFGVRRLLVLGGGRLPSPVPDEVIGRLQQRCPNGVWSLTDESFKKGDEVKIVEGCFSGIPAKFIEILPGDRVKIMLQWMGGDLEVSFPSSSIGQANF